MGFYCNAILIASVVCLAAPAHAQVKVITGEIEHIYGPGGQLLDDAELRLEMSEPSALDGQKKHGPDRR
jgi:hypothetical protein